MPRSYRFKAEKSVFHCTPDTQGLIDHAGELHEYGEGLHDMPFKWERLCWWLCEERPCLSGADAFVCVTETRIYVVFDSYCSVYVNTYASLEEALRHACFADLGEQLTEDER